MPQGPPYGPPPGAPAPGYPPPGANGEILGGLIPRNGKALAGYYCGLFAVLPALGIILGVLGIVFGAIGVQRANRLPGMPHKGFAIAGIVCGIIAVVLDILLFVFIFAAVGVALHAATVFTPNPT